ncbi:phage tail length tape measure family protein
MANALKLAIGVSIDPSAAKTGGASAQQAVAAIGEEAQRTATKLQTLINASVGLNSGTANQNAREWTGALASQGRSIDDLRAKYNPLFAVIREYKASLTEIRTLHAQGVLGTNEMAAAIMRERQATLASIDAIKGRNALSPGGVNDNNAGFRRQNLGYQLTDIAQSGFLGAPVGMIAAQQLPQIAQIYAGAGGVKTALADVGAIATSAIGAVGALPLALGVAGAAAIAYFRQAESSAKSVDEVLQQHQANIKALGEAYGVAEQRARAYSEADRAVAQAAAEGSLTDLVKKQVDSARDLRLQFGSIVTPGRTGQTFFNLQPNFKPFQSAFDDLDRGIRSGRVEGEKFIETVQQISKVNPAYEEFGNKILKAAQQFLQLNTEIKKSQDLLTQIGSLPRLDPLNIFSPERDAQAAAARIPSLFQQQQDRIAALRQQSAARSPAELEAAARATAAAQFNANEGSTARADRIELAGVQARVAAEKQLKDAQDARVRSLDNSLKSKQLELSLIGRTIGETERLRMEQQLITQLEEEAARNHTEVDPKEIAAIKEKAAAYGQLAEQIAATNAIRAHDETILQLRTEIALVGSSDARRRQALATLQAEQEIRQRGLSAGSDEANQIRERVNLESELTDTLRKQNEAWGSVRKAGEDAIDGIVGSIVDGDIDGALENIAKDVTKTFLQLGVSNPLKNALLGTDYGTLNDVGGVGGIFSKLFGRNTGADAVTSALGKAVGAMNVTAGTVMINGGVTGGVGGLATSLFGGAANSNLSGDISKYASAIKSIESSGNYGALGPITASGDRAYGAYQVMGANVGPWTQSALGYRLSPSAFLASPSAQDAVFSKIFGGYAGKFGASGAAQAWFGGPGSVGSGGGVADMLGTTGVQYVSKFNSALDRLSGTTTSAIGDLRGFGPAVGTATQGLSQFGNGVNVFGQNLSNWFPAAPSAGGGGFFSKLFGGLFGGNFSPIGAQATLAFNGGIGLYDDGGFTGAGGKHEVAGLVHRGEIVWSQADIARAGGRANVEGMRRGWRVYPGYADGGVAGTSSAWASSRVQSGNGQPANLNVKFNVLNNNGSEVTTRRKNTTDGVQFDIILDEAVADKISTPGSQARGAMASQFGLTGRLARR